MATRGSLLRMARHLRGFTQKKASEQLGVAQAVYSRMENDLVEIDDRSVDTAAAIFSLPRSFFDLQDTIYGPPVSVHTMLRGNSDVTARDVDMITAELNLRLIHIRRFLDQIEFKPTLELPRLDVELYDSPIAIAETVRRHWQLSAGPIRNLTRVMERAGVMIGYSDFGGAGVSGVTFSAPGRPPLVLLNPSHPADRVRFTLAHELGHMVMHRFPTAKMEEEANLFASAFLFPPSEVREAFRGRKVTLAFLAALKPEWKMSMQSILFAAQRQQLITANQARYLWSQIASKGWKTKEPSNLDFEHDKPTVLPTILKALQKDLGFKKDEIVHLAHVYEREFDKLYPYSDEGEARPRLRIVN